MNIRIEEISIEEQGPLKNLTIKPGDLTLIYGKNEAGKSFLVEFILKSLFKETKVWGYLRKEGRGRVRVSGVVNEKLLNFTPKGKSKKLEDYLTKGQNGLPVSLLRLIVVVGGKASFPGEEQGFSKKNAWEILSNRELLKRIDGKIKGSVKNCDVEDGIIRIEKRGVGKDEKNTKTQLQDLEKLFKEIREKYNIHHLMDLERKKQKLEEEKKELLKAKAFKAFKLQEKIKELNHKKEKLPSSSDLSNIGEEMNTLKERMRELKKKSIELKHTEEEIKELEKLEKEYENQRKAKRYYAYKKYEELEKLEKEINTIPEISELQHALEDLKKKKYEKQKYENERAELEKKVELKNYLESVKNTYSDFIGKSKGYPSSLPYYLIGAGFILFSVFSILMGYKLLSIFGMAGIVGVWVVYTLMTKKANKFVREEVEKIKQELKEKYGMANPDLAGINAFLNEISKSEAILERLKKELDEVNSEIRRIKENILRFLPQDLPEDKWEEKLRELKKRRDELEERLKRTQRDYDSLNIDSSDFIKKDEGYRYSKSELENLEKEVNSKRHLRDKKRKLLDEVSLLKEEIKEKSEKIKAFLNTYRGDVPDKPEGWEKEIRNLETEINRIEGEIQKCQGELNGLGVKNFVREDPGIEFDQEKLDEIEKQLNEVEEKIHNERNKLDKLKEEVKINVKDINEDESDRWEDLMVLIHKKIAIKKDELTEIQSRIIAGYAVHQALEELEKEEDQKIIEGLNSKEVTDTVSEITNRYENFEIEGNEVFISDKYNTFNLKDLSTGAKEQVLLALRIGFIRKILKRDNLFLILDDAFQHVDWEKRPYLVNSLFKLAQKGWQILYFTMDDHIRDLFNKKRTLLNEGFEYIEL